MLDVSAWRCRLSWAAENKTAEKIETEAAVTLLKTDAGFTVTAVHLKVRAKVPAPPDFKKAAEAAKASCPISRLLKAEITMESEAGRAGPDARR